MGPSGHYFARMWTLCGIVNCWDMFYTLGRAPRTKETLLDFREWCRVTRHPLAPDLGRHSLVSELR